MGREYEPTVGQWYEDLENEETFQVLKVDEDRETVEIQHLDGDIEEFDVDGWAELDLELTEEPPRGILVPRHFGFERCAWPEGRGSVKAT